MVHYYYEKIFFKNTMKKIKDKKLRPKYLENIDLMKDSQSIICILKYGMSYVI